MTAVNERPKLNWTVVKEFVEGDLVAEVSVSDSARPRYTVRVGRRGERGTLPFLPLFVEGQGRVSVKDISQTVARLIVQAQTFVQECAQAHEDTYIAQRLERESRQVEREGKKRRPSGYKQHHRTDRA